MSGRPGWLAAALLAIAVNAICLGVWYWNRMGDAVTVVELTERELGLVRGGEENSLLRLNLQFHDPGGTGLSSLWADSASFVALGFLPDRVSTGHEVEMPRGRPHRRPAWVLLRLDPLSEARVAGEVDRIAMLGVVLALNTVAELANRSHEVTWGVENGAGATSLGFGAYWFLYVARPIHLALLVAWFWRIVLVWSLFRRIAKLDLSLVPTHPDRAGGLGFLAQAPKMFAPVVLALGAVLAARWAHDIIYHDVHVKDLRMQMGAFVVVAVVLFSSPLLAFVPLMVKTKRQSLLDYAALVGRHGRLVRDRWIAGKRLDNDELLNAPELGPIADTGPAYDAVAAMQVFLIGKATVVPLLVAAALPLIPVLAIEIPITQILAALAKAVI